MVLDMAWLSAGRNFKLKLVLLFSLLFTSCLSSKKNVCILSGDKTTKLKVEIAKTAKEREVGLMNRPSLKQNEGMIFIFKEPAIRAFWMKNTLIPLSIGYFDKNKKLINIHKMRPAPKGQLNPVTYPSEGKTLYAVEANWGWFEKHGIKPGASLDFCR